MKNKTFPFFIFILLHLLCEKTICQDTTESIKYFSIRYSTSYNYKVLHYTPNVSFGFNKHNLYIGPEFNTILKTVKGDPVDIYEKNNWGLNLGYRYYSSEIVSNLKIFGQFNFSIYQIRLDIYQHGGPPFIVKHKELIVENTATIGIDYELFKNINLFSGIGIGSFNGFFLMIDSFTPSVYIGIEYKLFCPKQ
ncbi:MAG: hypothetical protein Q8T08_04605 [Ignavibacteria bacterium]|nr:hypothetical protein [Ignavibacteria bacterium]